MGRFFTYIVKERPGRTYSKRKSDIVKIKNILSRYYKNENVLTNHIDNLTQLLKDETLII